MAKRKHAAALFEVFHDNRGLDQRAPASRSPRWWFKTRGESESQPASDPNDPTTATIKSPLIAPRIAAVEAMEPRPAPVAAPAPVRPQAVAPPIEAAAMPQTAKTTVPSAVTPAASPVSPAPAIAPAPQPSRRFHFDREGKELTLRVRLAHTIAAAFGILLIIGLAYVQGRRGTTPAEAASAPVDPAPIADVPARNVQASALDVPRRPNHPPATLKPAPAVPEPRAHEHEAGPIANSVHGLTAAPPPAPAPAPAPVPDDRRMTGLNYVIVQSYPDQAGAIEARNFLLKNGVACTVEKAPPGWMGDATWSSVITIRGFERDQLHTAACENLIKQIEKLADKFAGTGKFKKFEPHLYRWK